MKKILIITMLTVCSAANAEIYKCTGKDGKATYQAKQCPNDAAKVSTVSPADKVTTAQKINGVKLAAKAENDAKIYKAIANHVVIPGMTKEDAVSSVGNPTSINHGQYGDTHTEQWIYRNGNKSSYVYFRNEILTSVQWSQ